MITVSFYAVPSLAHFINFRHLPNSAVCVWAAAGNGKALVVAVLVAIRLILAVREDSGVVLFSVGFYLVVSRRYPKSVLQSAPSASVICCSH